MKISKIVCGFFLLLMLNACISTQNTTWQAYSSSANTFNTDGRLAVQADGKGHYVSFDWSHGEQVQIMDINTPLGNTVGRLCKDAQGVVITDAHGHQFQAESSTILTQQLLGFPVPLDSLDLWALGYYRADENHRITPDGDLEQSGWRIHREITKQGAPKMLSLLSLSKEALLIKLVFQQFSQPYNHQENQCFRQPEI